MIFDASLVIGDFIKDNWPDNSYSLVTAIQKLLLHNKSDLVSDVLCGFFTMSMHFKIRSYHAFDTKLLLFNGESFLINLGLFIC